MKQLLPNAKRIGVPFNPAEDNDKTNLTEMRAAAAKAGLEIVEVGIDGPNDVAQRLQSLKGKVDVLFVIQSNLLQTSLPVIAATAQRIGVPAINTLDTPVRNGSFLAAHALNTSLALRQAIWRKADPAWPVCGKRSSPASKSSTCRPS